MVQEFVPTLAKEQAQEIIRTWLKTGVLKTTLHYDPERRKKCPGLFVVKRPGDTWEG